MLVDAEAHIGSPPALPLANFLSYRHLGRENSRWQCVGTPCREGCAVPGKANDVTGFSTLTADMPSTPGSATVAMP